MQGHHLHGTVLLFQHVFLQVRGKELSVILLVAYPRHLIVQYFYK